ELVALGGARARILLHDGDALDAIDLASLGLRVGRRVSAADNVDLFGIYMASAFQTVSLLDLEHAARETRLTPDAARALVRLLEATRWRSEDWQRVWSLEYGRVWGEVVAESTRPGSWDGLGWPLWLLPSAYRWHPNQTAAGVADVYRDQRRKSAQFCAVAGLLGDGGPLRRRGIAELLAPNAIGQFVIDEVRARGFDRIQLNRC